MKVSMVLRGLVTVFGVASATRSLDNPVTRVVKLLEELKGRLEDDHTKEQAVFDKYACWCEEVTSKKAQSITDTRNQLKTGGTTILELRGTVATTVAEIEKLTTDIKKNEEAQQKATNIRSKENAAYVAEKMETEQAIAALEAAVSILKEATGGVSLRQKSIDGPSKAKLATALSALHAFVIALPQAHQNATQLSALSTATAYSPQSATVQGILGDMYSTFTNNLETSAQTEATAHRNFENLMADYQEELETMQTTLQKKEKLKVESERMLADATQEYSDAEAALKADTDFFDTTKAACVSKTEAWSERKSHRTQEMEGIEKALTILTSDEVKDLFSKSIKPGYDKAASFLQVRAASRASPLDRASQALQDTAKAAKSPRLAALAATVRAKVQSGDTGHFDKVIASIDELMQILASEGKEDVVRADGCKAQYQAVSLAQEKLAWKIKKNVAFVAKQEKLKEKTQEKIDQTVKDLEELAKDVDAMTTSRETENEQFKQDKQDDEKAIELLKEAKAALAAYYAEHASSLLEAKTAKQEPDARLSDKGSNKNEAKGITAILQQIIEDLEDEIEQGKKAEEKAQVIFEERLAAANALERDLQEKETNLGGVVAQADADINQESETKTANTDDLKVEDQTLADIKPQCDWIISNQAERAKKRETELQGLSQAKEFLSGYRPPALVQAAKGSRSS